MFKRKQLKGIEQQLLDHHKYCPNFCRTSDSKFIFLLNKTVAVYTSMWDWFQDDTDGVPVVCLDESKGIFKKQSEEKSRDDDADPDVDWEDCHKNCSGSGSSILILNF